MIDVRAARVDRAGRSILHGVELHVASGEVVVLAGPNGAGKSTLLSVVTGDVPLAAGTVAIDGRPIAGRALGELARLRAVVRQGTRVSAPMTVAEVVLLGRTPHGDADRAAGRDAALLAMRAAGVAHLADRPVPHLSGGEAQRVHLARALAQVAHEALGGGPAHGALLLDEPIAALDLAWRVEAIDRLRQVARAGLAVLVVLHDLDLAARAADRLVVLDQGAVVAAGAPTAVLTPSLLARVFGVRATVAAAPWDPARPWIGIEGLAAPGSAPPDGPPAAPPASERGES